VQAFRSSQAPDLGAWAHPDVGSHVSSVQELWSSHAAALLVNRQSPVAASQVSTVQALPSSQTRRACVHPTAGLQVSIVHGLESLQLFGAPPTQAPPWQESVPVQAFPSEHEVPFARSVQLDVLRPGWHAWHWFAGLRVPFRWKTALIRQPD
jgi:hypothetical protein